MNMCVHSTLQDGADFDHKVEEIIKLLKR
jgi:hypothetical protein